MKNNDKEPLQDRPEVNPLRPSLSIDYELYQKYLDDFDMSEAQKRELLDALWSIIVSFVDLGFGVHPLQQVSGECAQLENSDEFLTSESADMVRCDQQSKSQLENITDRQSGLPKERSQK